MEVNQACIQAPEALNGKKKVTQKGDVYSFGGVLLELAHWEVSFRAAWCWRPRMILCHGYMKKKKTLSEIIDPCLLKGSSEQIKLINGKFASRVHLDLKLVFLVFAALSFGTNLYPKFVHYHNTPL